MDSEQLVNVAEQSLVVHKLWAHIWNRLLLNNVKIQAQRLYDQIS